MLEAVLRESALRRTSRKVCSESMHIRFTNYVQKARTLQTRAESKARSRRPDRKHHIKRWCGSAIFCLFHKQLRDSQACTDCWTLLSWSAWRQRTGHKPYIHLRHNQSSSWSCRHAGERPSELLRGARARRVAVWTTPDRHLPAAKVPGTEFTRSAGRVCSYSQFRTRVPKRVSYQGEPTHCNLPGARLTPAFEINGNSKEPPRKKTPQQFRAKRIPRLLLRFYFDT